MRDYLSNLAKRNLLRLGSKLEGISLGLVEQRVAQEFRQVE